MSKLIRVTDGVYIALDALREKRETFSEVVERCVKTTILISGIRDGLPASHYLQERPVVEADAEDRSIKARTIRR